VTAHNPAFGTREYEKTYATGRVLERIGRYKISDWMIDGNHVSVVGDEAVWKRQLKLLGGYAAFYNPWNLLRALRHDRSDCAAGGLAIKLWVLLRRCGPL